MRLYDQDGDEEEDRAALTFRNLHNLILRLLLIEITGSVDHSPGPRGTLQAATSWLQISFPENSQPETSQKLKIMKNNIKLLF